MTELTSRKCEACRVGAPKVTQQEIEQYLPLIPNWTIINVEGVDQLQREFTFPDFLTAVSFTNKVAELAEQEGHHPAILTEWGNVTVTWWTHKIHGLHLNDFIAAAKTDAIKIS